MNYSARWNFHLINSSSLGYCAIGRSQEPVKHQFASTQDRHIFPILFPHYCERNKKQVLLNNLKKGRTNDKGIFCLFHRFLVPHSHRCIPGQCSRCENNLPHHHHTASLSMSRNASISRESVHAENVSASTGMFNQSVSVSSSHKDPTIRRQHSQPESSCLYCHAHRLVYRVYNVKTFFLYCLSKLSKLLSLLDLYSD